MHRRRLRLQLPAHDEPAHGPGQGLLRRHRRPAAFLDGKAKTITGYKATGKYTLEVDLQKPIATFLYIMEMPFSAPVAKEWVAKWGKQVGRHPLGTGPYVADHWTASQDLLLERNTNFTGTTAGYLDAIDFEFSITPSTAVLKVQSGDADLLGDYIPPANFPSLSVNPTWKSQVVVEPAIALDYLFFNMTVKPFDNLAVRQALSWAIDRAKIVKLLSGTGLPLNQIYPAGLPGHVDGPAGNFYGYDPAKAKQMLAAAGYPNGFTMTLYSHNVAPWPTVIQSIQYDLAQIGVKASIKLLDRPSYWTLIGKKGAVGAGLNDWWMDYPDPFDYIVSLFSKSSAIDEGTNPSFWWDPKVETDLANAQVMTRPGRPPGEVPGHPDLHHEPGSRRAPLPGTGDHAALQAHRRHLPAPGVDLRLRALLDQQVAGATT